MLHRLLTVVALAVLFLVPSPSDQAADILVVHRNANLREQATTQSAILDRLTPGDELTPLADTRTNGFWHVRTGAGLDGWVYYTLVHREESDAVVVPTFPGAAPAVLPAWDKPAPQGSVLAPPPGKDPCPADGEPGGDIGTNRRKNRIDVPTEYHPITFQAIAALPDPNAPAKRSKWTPPQLQVIEPFEGVAVSVIGYIVAVRNQNSGSGEATNCHYTASGFVDLHIALVERPGQGEEQAVVIEPTPRFYAAHPTWRFATINDLEHTETPVRFSGWLLFDPVHKNHLGTYRSTLWEIHPVTRVEVFENGQWRDW